MIAEAFVKYVLWPALVAQRVCRNDPNYLSGINLLVILSFKPDITIAA